MQEEVSAGLLQLSAYSLQDTTLLGSEPCYLPGCIPILLLPVLNLTVQGAGILLENVTLMVVNL